MIKINIHKGFLSITDEDGQTFPGWIGDDPPSYPDLPEVKDVYDRCMSRNYSPERIIDTLLYIFHRQRLIRGGFLSKLPLVVGFVGAAGSGKSVSEAAVGAFDYMLTGCPVVSNMDIEVTVRYRAASKTFRSQDLDKLGILDIKHLQNMYMNVAIILDEINIEHAEARRSMTNRNLAISYVLQERRKRGLNLLHSEPNEMWGDDRLRFSTGIYIKCRDGSYPDPKPEDLGKKTIWKVYDLGAISGESLDDRDPRFVVGEFDFHSRPWWNCYDSWQIQGLEDEDSDIKIKDTVKLAELKAKYADSRALLNQIVEAGLTEADSAYLWQMLGIEDDRSRQTIVGQQLADLGVKNRLSNGRKIYLFPKSRFNGGDGNGNFS